MNKRTLYIYFVSILLLGFSILTAQDERTTVSNDEIETFFAKTELVQKTGQLSFNVVNITNKTNNPIPLKPRLSVPEGFAIFSTAFTDTIIPPNTTIRLPYRLRISNIAAGDVKHKVVFRAFSDNNQLLLENTSIVQPEAFHDWEVDLPNDRMFFYPRYNLAEFDVVIKNNGNVGEYIKLEITPDRKLSFSDEMEDDWEANQTIYLPPKSDSIVNFKVNYTYSKDRVFDLSTVNILASTADKEIRKAAFVEKYTDEYSPLIVDNTMPHATEIGVRTRTITNTSEMEPFVYARGASEFKNKSSFKYFYSNYRLNDMDNFIRNSNYRFLYNWEGLSVGLGTFGSQLGRNLYSRNALMVDWKGEVGPGNTIEGFASQDILDPKTSGAAAHWWDNGKYNLHSAASYNANGVNKINTATLLFNTKEIPIYKEHFASAVLYGLREDHYSSAKYFQQGYAWDVTYHGNFGTRFRAKLFHNYGSRDIPGNQMGMLNFGAMLTFFPKNLMTYFTARGHYYSRNYYYRDYQGERLPNIYLQDKYFNFIFNNNKNPNFLWSLGPGVERYHARRPDLTDLNYSTYKVWKYGLEYKAYAFKSLRFEIEAGMRDIYYEGNNLLDTTMFDLHLNANYGYNGIGIRVKYDYGPLVNSGLYQRAADLTYNGINVGPYIVKGFARNRVVIQLYTNYLYRFDLRYSYLNLSPRVELYLARNWYAKATGNYTYFRQDTPEYYSENSNYFVALSIVKKWGNSEYFRKQRQLKRIKIVCFKDENGNGRKDKYEEGIPHIKTRLKLIREEVQPKHESFPVDIALLTNEKGFVIFNQVPKGFYELDVIPLIDMREYFYVSRTHEQIDLIENMIYYVPFQKASKIDGNINVEKAKFGDEKPVDLGRIKITAYNKAGNSYSAFTRKDGTFTVYVPGDTTYFLRLENVFGSNYKLLQNDIAKKVPDPSNELVVFNFVEKTRQVNFKKAKTPTKGGPQKTKILKGKIYENTDRKPIDRDALPEFNMGDGTSYEKSISSGKFYVVLSQNLTYDDALKAVGIYQETGIESFFGFEENTATHYVFTEEYIDRNEAQKGLKEVQAKGVKKASIMVFK